MDGSFAPGPVRGWWWRSSRAQRLAVAGVGAVLGLALLIGAFAGMPTGGPQGVAATPLVPIPPLTTIAATTTTTTVTTTTATTTSTVDRTTTTSPSPTTTTVTTTPPPPTTIGPPITTIEPPTTTDEIQYGVRAGMPCAPEGAIGVTPAGIPVVCMPGATGKLKWRRP